MDSHGHSYQKGKCIYCGREDWLIDGESDCYCKGKRDYEQGIINEEESNED